MSPRLGDSQSITDQWTYVQDVEPPDERPGVRWIDTSGETNVARAYSAEYADWVRETRVWVQETQPEPRVGPLDGDRWVDSSQDSRPTLVYSNAIGGWENPVDISWGEVADKPPETGVVSYEGGYFTIDDSSAFSQNSDASNLETITMQWSTDNQDTSDDPVDEIDWGSTENTSNANITETNVNVEGTQVLSRSGPASGTFQVGELYSDLVAYTYTLEVIGHSNDGSDASVGLTVGGHQPALAPHVHPRE